ncbi:MAG: hypothetical protein LBI01_01165 [Elusimicrobium sp.]|jgi:hypothetical protein|nr:hypothetical protein [Elusimicrobium sp.]
MAAVMITATAAARPPSLRYGAAVLRIPPVSLTSFAWLYVEKFLWSLANFLLRKKQKTH